VKLLTGLVLTSLLLTSACSFSDDHKASTAPAQTSNENTAMVPSIIFIQFLNQQAPSVLCEQDAGIQCLAMPAELCIGAVQASAERCGPALLEQWPASFEETQENAQKYSAQYRQCIMADWINEFGLERSRLNSCGIEVNP